MKFLKYFLIASLMLPVTAQADEQRIGFVAGSTHGVGLGYSRQHKDGTGWQVSALPIVEDNFDAIFRKNKVVDKKLKVVDDDWNEKRIDIIGSNGPTGEHYNQS